ncbi:hypothetical protein QE152_g25122 [Popillia japonica]|uniref:Uncharacterized protein n=1 Tax=Popillia japonica TaxID=7064 RepID=A0AAW1K2M9_POPJA
MRANLGTVSSTCTVTIRRKLITIVVRWTLVLDEFNYQIEHRSGQKMEHLDLLSINPVMLTVNSKFLQKLKVEQKEYEYLNTIRKLIEAGHEHKDYFLRYDLLHKVCGGRDLLAT